MISLRITGGDVALYAAKKTGGVLLSGASGAGMGYVGAKFSKTNVVAAAIIGGCEKLVDATVECVLKQTLGETRNAKIITAVSSFLIRTIATIASLIFGLTSPGMAVLASLFSLAFLGWSLYQAFHSETTPVAQPTTEQMEVVVEAEEPEGTDAATDVSPKDPQQDAVVLMQLDNSMDAFKLAIGRLNIVPGQIDVKNQSLGDNLTVLRANEHLTMVPAKVEPECQDRLKKNPMEKLVLV